MGRKPCCAKEGLNRGAWTSLEDEILVSYIKDHGEGKWRSLPKRAGLMRCGKSCRLRWLNYLRPGIKRGNISDAEEELIIRLHNLLGNRWSLIAGRLPGRTDNEIKNYWNTTLAKKVSAGAHQAKPTAEAVELIQTKAQRCTRSFFPQELLLPSSEPVTAFSSKEAGYLPGNELQFGGGGGGGKDGGLFLDGLFIDGLSMEDWIESADCFQMDGDFSLATTRASLLIGAEEEWLSCEFDL